MGMVFVVFGYIASYTLIFALSLCIAAGLFWVAELAEEFSVLTGKILKWSIVGIEVVHVLLYVDGLFPLPYMLLSMAANGAFALLLHDFPFIELTSIKFILGVVGVLINHFCWVHFFYQVHFTILQTISFLVIIVWFIPFSFFVSTSVADNVLPSGPSEVAAKKQSNIFIGLVNTVTDLWAKATDDLAPGLAKQR
mmetsp:Transcript_90422/g.258357  ORF Transcript_90422/g.258357 Transcript_90422/m.258357 type:complete len:195 (+) Transcript_90422:96-680(+)|eukprot:CAMPEP_0119501052 /NCGR_PEP_ID=MMETSP1344-20130328/23011_1 /TAXON_ID=236787 /ORGANISM="Florenciella parvula, Strain CCMP2471" /LENGTH=194 /DNA_ID=CAMNT_0007537189 /DNA_START=76 /DNA_END=660 /DNA_ORIENTATION=-